MNKKQTKSQRQRLIKKNNYSKINLRSQSRTRSSSINSSTSFVSQERIITMRRKKEGKPTKKDGSESIRKRLKNTKTIEEYSQTISHFIKQKDRSKPNKENGVNGYYLMKKCELCQDFSQDHLLLICDECEDAYHTFCLNPPLKKLPDEDEDFTCPRCREDLKIHRQKIASKQSTLEDHRFVALPKNIFVETKCCSKCNGVLKIQKKQDRNKFIQCPKCKNDYHLKECYNKEYSKNKSVFCSSCEEKIKKLGISHYQGGQNQSILNYFASTKKISYDSVHRLKQIPFKELPQKRGRRQKAIIVKKKKPQFKMAKIDQGSEIYKEAKYSLFKALEAKEIIFDDDLYFPEKDYPSSSNNASLEPSVQKLSAKNEAIFLKFKTFTRKGFYAPIRVINDPIQGACVEATANISDLSLICEYVGDVLPVRKVLFDDNDSIMDLLKAPSSSSSLVIYPKSRANLARFISGINNSDEKSRKKQNLKSARFNIQGQMRVILYANRDIKKGELLYYDYNEGGFENYPTEEFV